MRFRLVAAAGACALGAVGVYAAAFDTGAGRRFDARTLSEVIYGRSTLTVPQVEHGLLQVVDLASMLLLGAGIVVRHYESRHLVVSDRRVDRVLPRPLRLGSLVADASPKGQFRSRSAGGSVVPRDAKCRHRS